MTVEQEKTGLAEPSEEKRDITDQPHGTDWCLAWVISCSETFGIEPQVTLYVGGQLISGYVVSARRHFELTGELLKSSQTNAPEMLEVWAEAWAQMQNYYPVASPDDFGTRKYEYIHLRDARCLVGKTPIPEGGVLWRGKLSSVDGFHLGLLAAVSD